MWGKRGLLWPSLAAMLRRHCRLIACPRRNILFGGVGSDVIEMAMVQRSKRDVEDMQRQVQAALAWAQSNSAVYQHKVAELKAQVPCKRHWPAARSAGG